MSALGGFKVILSKYLPTDVVFFVACEEIAHEEVEYEAIEIEISPHGALGWYVWKVHNVYYTDGWHEKLEDVIPGVPLYPGDVLNIVTGEIDGMISLPLDSDFQ